jgi:nickel/cobalt transporter (NicO) family protein
MTKCGRRVGSILAAAFLALLVPALVLAHPLGNFTINHFAALRVAPDRISLDVVIDRAEIPAFQEQQRLDTDGDGALTGPELADGGRAGCADLSGSLALTVDGRAVSLDLRAAGLSLPPGSAGLPTMRLVCEYEAALTSPIASTTAITFQDRSFAERIGWREIVVLGDGVTIAGAPASASAAGGVSDRLASYPTDLLTQPLDVRSVAVSVVPGGPTLTAWSAPDAQPLVSNPATPARSQPVSMGVVPGGVTENLAALIDVGDLTPLAILASLAVAFGLGVVHALSPGHGKTIMAAYLVGTRGSSRQAIGLGLAVTVSHTAGVLALAGITLAASSVLPPERLYPVLGVASGALVIAIGSSLLWTRLRALTASRRARGATRAGNAALRFTWHADDGGHADGAGHDHGHDHGHEHGHDRGPTALEAGGTISTRGLVALGLSGGLVPSASALILLLGSIAAGRVAYGLVLVLGFGAGMAVVLAGIGLLIVHARALVERRPSVAGLRRLTAPIQLVTASLVVVLGVVLTGQALTQVL